MAAEKIERTYLASKTLRLEEVIYHEVTKTHRYFYSMKNDETLVQYRAMELVKNILSFPNDLVGNPICKDYLILDFCHEHAGMTKLFFAHFQ